MAIGPLVDRIVVAGTHVAARGLPVCFMLGCGKRAECSARPPKPRRAAKASDVVIGPRTCEATPAGTCSSDMCSSTRLGRGLRLPNGSPMAQLRRIPVLLPGDFHTGGQTCAQAGRLQLVAAGGANPGTRDAVRLAHEHLAIRVLWPPCRWHGQRNAAGWLWRAATHDAELVRETGKRWVRCCVPADTGRTGKAALGGHGRRMAIPRISQP